mmetsp:Transcript_23904/g.42315  ORF Transcript_23904/g.42315 Transcript_23904/m.42315 type:complete len:531 (-) Transcript_23904:74-1666(-)
MNPLKVLFASQTGNCEEISSMVFEGCLLRGLPAERHCLGEINEKFSLSRNDVVVIVTSSTGDGDIPDNGYAFLRWIRRVEDGSFSGLKFALLGLGDSNYNKFQGGPRTVKRLLEAKGASHFYTIGEADEQCGLEGTVEPWIAGLWEPLKKQLESRESVPLETVSAIPDEEPLIIKKRILQKRLLTEPNAAKKTVELTIDASGLAYTPAGHILVYPQNEQEHVESALAVLKWEASFELTNLKYIPPMVAHRVTLPITLRDFMISCVDLVTVPLKTTQAALLHSCLSSDEEKQSLKELIEASKLSLPSEYTLLGTLTKYSSWTNLPFAKLMPNLPTLAPRYYSILSSPLESPSVLKIAFTVTGVCTRYMDRLSESDLQLNEVSLEFMFQHEPSVFSSTALEADKLFILCNGVGLTPFVGVLDHLVRLNKQKQVWVVYGCRQGIQGTPHENYDFIYEESLRSSIESLSGKLDVAFSRGSDPKYIQDILQAETSALESFLEGSVALLCGSFNIKQLSDYLTKLAPELVIRSESS